MHTCIHSIIDLIHASIQACIHASIHGGEVVSLQSNEKSLTTEFFRCQHRTKLIWRAATLNVYAFNAKRVHSGWSSGQIDTCSIARRCTATLHQEVYANTAHVHASQCMLGGEVCPSLWEYIATIAASTRHAGWKSTVQDMRDISETSHSHRHPCISAQQAPQVLLPVRVCAP